MKKTYSFLIFLLLISFQPLFAQGWELELSSNVEIRTWKLTTKADEDVKPLSGATIKLLKGATVIKQMTSDGSGDFTIKVPANGEFILEVSYPGCNAKRAWISTMNVPDFGEEIFKPSFSIGGFIMAKPFPGIDYTGLQQALVKVTYDPRIRNFDDDESYTNQGLGAVSKIAGAEQVLIERFCSTNKSGDDAMKKPDCPLAKTLYEKAMTIIPDEQYPVQQLQKVGECLKEKELAEQKAKEEAAKAEAEKLAKAAKEAGAKAQKEKDLAAKAEADKLAKQKEEEEKAKKAKDAAAKAEADKTAKAAKEAELKTQKEKDLAAKAEADKLAKQKATEEKAKKEAEQKAKAEADKLAKNKTPVQAATPPPTTTSTVNAEPKKNNGITILGTGTPKESGTKTKSGSANYSVRQELGSGKYNDAIQKADNFMANKQYTEAKAAFQEALKLKPKDVYATSRLAEVEKLMKK